MGVDEKRTERFQGRVESQAVAAACEYAKEPVSTLLCSSPVVTMNVGPARGKERRVRPRETVLSRRAGREGRTPRADCDISRHQVSRTERNK